MAAKEREKEDKRKAAAAAERAARDRYEAAVAQIRDGSYRFSSCATACWAATPGIRS